MEQELLQMIEAIDIEKNVIKYEIKSISNKADSTIVFKRLQSKYYKLEMLQVQRDALVELYKRGKKHEGNV